MKKAIVIVCGICVSAACVCMACKCGAPGGPEVFNNDTLSEFHAVHGNPTCMCQCNRYHKFGVYSNECKNVCRICNGDKNGNNRGADSIHDYPDDAEYCGCPVHGAAMANDYGSGGMHAFSLDETAVKRVALAREEKEAAAKYAQQTAEASQRCAEMLEQIQGQFEGCE